MKVIHFSIDYIRRSKGNSVVGTAAYCAGERLYNQYDGRTHDYSHKREVVYSQILLPDYAPIGFADRATLWNAVELGEKNYNAQLGRTIIIALPIELERDEQINLIRNYTQTNFVGRGMCADVCVHDKQDGNPHAHVILTLRSLDSKGNWLEKSKKNYILDEDGRRIYDPVKKCYLCGRSIQINDWNQRGKAEIWRREWAVACNREFERKGLDCRLTNESYVRQGIDLEPTIHLGRAVMAMEQRGIITDRGNEYRAIEARNKEREDRERSRRQEREYTRDHGRASEFSR